MSRKIVIVISKGSPSLFVSGENNN